MGNLFSHSNARWEPMHACIIVSLTDLQHVLEGVVRALGPDNLSGCAASEWLESLDNPSPAPVPDENAMQQDGSLTGRSFQEWNSLIEKPCPNIVSYRLACLTLAAAVLRATSRSPDKRCLTVPDLKIVWGLIEKGLSTVRGGPEFGKVIRGSQGFVIVTICTFPKDHGIGELLRLHLWLPDGKRCHPGFEIHAHQAFAQSWVLGGFGKDLRYVASDVQNSEEASAAKFAMTRTNRKQASKHPKLTAVSSIVKNTGELVKVSCEIGRTFGQNNTYSIPAGVYHRSEVAPDQSFATLFYFDAERDFVPDAKVLGPKDCKFLTVPKEHVQMTASQVVEEIKKLREFEDTSREQERRELEEQRMAENQRRLESKRLANIMYESEEEDLYGGPQDFDKKSNCEVDGGSMEQSEGEILGTLDVEMHM